MILPEGLAYNKYSKKINFVDIKDKKLYEILSSKPKKLFIFDETISFAVAVSKEKFLIGYSNKLCSFNLVNKEIKIIKTIKDNYFRTNDAFLDDHGNLWFGVMHNSDNTEKGGLYRFNYKDGLCTFDEDYHIPNGPVKSPSNGYLIHNDSFLGYMYIYEDTNSSKSRKVLFDCNNLSDSCSPDGMCFDELGNLYVAMWGYGHVCVFNHRMQIIEQIKTPTIFPTNVLVKDKKIFITYAEDEKNKLKGGIIILEH